MIVVIADDISGAAEIAAIGTQHGLNAQVQTRFDPNPSIDLVAVDTDTRSGCRQNARRRIADLAQRLHTQAAQIEWCFKKVDSVLRGHVYTETTTLMRGLGKTHAILAPANPSKGRTIVTGRYLIDGRPLDQTDFANDPEYPAHSCLVADLIGGPIQFSQAEAYQAQNGLVVVAQTQHVEQFAPWAEQVQHDVLPAGGADFFKALLEHRHHSLSSGAGATPIRAERPAFYVCGSGSNTSHQAITVAAKRGAPVCLMPKALRSVPLNKDESLIRSWANDIVVALERHGRAIAAIPGPVRNDAELALRLRAHMATMTDQVMRLIVIRELIIEGGATARAILDRMDCRTLTVKGAYAPGVVRMQVQGQNGYAVTIKPGSYPWPEHLWEA